MSIEPCAVCHRPGSVGCPELRMTLCWECDARFLAWYATHGWCVASDWPGLVGSAA